MDLTPETVFVFFVWFYCKKLLTEYGCHVLGSKWCIYRVRAYFFFPNSVKIRYVHWNILTPMKWMETNQVWFKWEGDEGVCGVDINCESQEIYKMLIYTVNHHQSFCSGWGHWFNYLKIDHPVVWHLTTQQIISNDVQELLSVCDT